MPIEQELMQKAIELSLFFLIFGLLFCASLIVIYILKAIALNKICRIYGVSDRWLSWIPVLNHYLILKIGERGVSYTFLPIIKMILLIVGLTSQIESVRSASLIGFIICSIWWMVVLIQALQVMLKKLDSNSGLFVAGIFFSIFMVIGWAILTKKIDVLEKQGYFANVSKEDGIGL